MKYGIRRDGHWLTDVVSSGGPWREIPDSVSPTRQEAIDRAVAAGGTTFVWGSADEAIPFDSEPQAMSFVIATGLAADKAQIGALP